MIAIDTNVVVRFLVNDDRDQARRARALIDGEDVFVATSV
jgi:predicted nucleic-acid-binding protein